MVKPFLPFPGGQSKLNMNEEPCNYCPPRSRLLRRRLHRHAPAPFLGVKYGPLTWALICFLLVWVGSKKYGPLIILNWYFLCVYKDSKLAAHAQGP